MRQNNYKGKLLFFIPQLLYSLQVIMGSRTAGGGGWGQMIERTGADFFWSVVLRPDSLPRRQRGRLALSISISPQASRSACVCTGRAKSREKLSALAAPCCLAPEHPNLCQMTLFFLHIINLSVSHLLSPSPCLPLNCMYLY